MQNLLKTIPDSYALKNLILPLREENGIVVIAMADTINSEFLNELKFIFNKDIITEKWPQEELLYCSVKAYREEFTTRRGIWIPAFAGMTQSQNSNSRSNITTRMNQISIRSHPPGLPA
jgi:hypothetical protein